ncbi:hypothetical protein Ccar_00010 [Clostridium carboxidivorans P7]|uniref:Uncharacterized protein n=1 Tax=Clostridium carboxidivorans P7 TaxID=536227 RepID=C6PQL5_9CLOT|nr:hypothetical protein [Clostridium carboxidivorans]AKN29303.1 hypothetical protein Ccar_00010 [Clostridium carboxidivorans P7]EET88387.1 conserved hypothetical protein [Clostridium carboxidivorans P7]EFG89791.1 hypothetical protein CLCAR_0957 [Clostridium carboxidivorans P7]
MIKLSVFEFFCRGIPEAFIFVLASLLFTKKKIDKKNLFISSILYAITVYLVRMLPIHLGVHSIILIMIYIVISVLINKITINKSIFCTLIEFSILSICELTNLFILGWLKVDMQGMLSNPAKKVLYFIPSLILFSSILALFYIVICKNRKTYLGVQK